MAPGRAPRPPLRRPGVARRRAVEGEAQQRRVLGAAAHELEKWLLAELRYGASTFGHELQQPIQESLEGRRGWGLVRRTAPDTHEGLCEGRRETVHLEEALVGRVPVWKSNSVSGAPDNSSLSHFSAMTWPRWLRRAVRSRHRHAIEQMSRRWRGGQRGDSGRTRRRFDFHTTGYQTAPKKS